MELESQDQFPLYETARILLDDEEKMNYFPTKIPLVGGAVKLPPNNTIPGEERETFCCAHESNYDANNTMVDIPLKEDLAADKTLVVLLSYLEKLAENALKDEASEEEDFMPIMSELSP